MSCVDVMFGCHVSCDMSRVDVMCHVTWTDTGNLSCWHLQRVTPHDERVTPYDERVTLHDGE